jgi:Na+-driven multidrug efflux pump
MTKNSLFILLFLLTQIFICIEFWIVMGMHGYGYFAMCFISGIFAGWGMTLPIIWFFKRGINEHSKRDLQPNPEGLQSLGKVFPQEMP